LAGCDNKMRVGAVFHLLRTPPKQHNIIIFDDFVTTCSTFKSMYFLLKPLNYNLVFFTGINNKL
jgi:adenine/guanine phosphoribosyltransferase-like PRPP-binding protein